MKEKLFEYYASSIEKQFNISLKEMFTQTKTSHIVDARQLLYWLCIERPIKRSYIKIILKILLSQMDILTRKEHEQLNQEFAYHKKYSILGKSNAWNYLKVKFGSRGIVFKSDAIRLGRNTTEYSLLILREKS